MGSIQLLKGVRGAAVDVNQFIADIEALTVFKGEVTDNNLVEQANNAIRARCLSEISMLQSRLALLTVESYLCGYRKAIDEYFSKKDVLNKGVFNGRYECHIAKTFMVLKHDELEQCKAQRDENLERKLKEPIKIADPVGYLKKAHELMQSYYWHDIAVGLMAVTGRRATEIYKTAFFKTCLEDWQIGTNVIEKEYCLLFGGQLKKRNEEDMGTYPIPVLAEPDMVLWALKQLRAKCDYSDVGIDRVNARIGNKVSRFVRDSLQEYVETRLTAKSCRDIYVLLSMLLVTDYRGTRMVGFYAKNVLGHGGGGAALNYMPAVVKKEGYEALKDYMVKIWEKSNFGSNS